MSNNDSLSDEDKALFRKTVGDVTPIHTQSTSHHKPLSTAQPHPRPTSREPAPTPNIYLSDTTLYPLGSESPLFYCQSALSRVSLSNLKRGQLPIEGRLDLHGMTSSEAKEALILFIMKHHQLKHRVLLIIHGKGRHTDQPVLKNLVNHWLPQFPQVLAFVSATPKDGGSGAVYVLLKSQK